MTEEKTKHPFIKYDKSHFGRAPIYFYNQEKQKEWDEFSEVDKRFIRAHLLEVASQFSHEAALDLLCHLINDLHARVEELEKKL